VGVLMASSKVDDVTLLKQMRPKDLSLKIDQLRKEGATLYYQREYKEFVDVNCPACQGEAKALWGEKYSFKHQKCRECETVYVSPRPTQERLFQYYLNYEAPKMWRDVVRATSETRMVTQYEPRVRALSAAINKAGANRNHFLDFGAGVGGFAQAVKRSGSFGSVAVFDPDSEVTTAVSSSDIEVYSGTIEDLPDCYFDAVSMNDVIEHVFDPGDLLKSLHSKLTDNGILFIVTPNSASIEYDLLNTKSRSVGPPEHMQYFRPSSISLLLKDSLFSLIDVSTPGELDVEILKEAIADKRCELNATTKFLKNVFDKKDVDMDEALQKFIMENKLSSHMVAIAQKVS